MVRVISVHHFDGQIIQTCDEPLAIATAPPDRLLVALPHHIIEVRNLLASQEPLFSFPTVDQVSYLEHSVTGNYVVTLERKQTRLGRETIYTRVYTNWEQCGEQPMRARIAGRVTPSSSQTGGDTLEMIELPVKFSTTSCIACCQATGNILVGCERWLCLYQLVMRTHDISRQRFLDFEPWPVTIELSFAPLQLAMVEDVVAAADNLCLHVFRINKGFARVSDWSSSSSHSGSPHSNKFKNKKEEVKKNDPKTEVGYEAVDLDILLKEVSDASSIPKQRLLVANGSLPVLALLPGIKCSLSNNPARDVRVSPFKPPHSVTMGVAIKEVPVNEVVHPTPWAEKMTTMVESLLQLELGPASEEGMREEFRCLVLRPLYKVMSQPSPAHSEMSCPRLRSARYNSLVGFNCLISTQQEGYMYHFPVEEGEVMSLGRCISVYSFTSAVKFICLEPFLLHALTTTGLETYTMRAVHAVHSYNGIEACPPTDDPVCLVGLRPFLGVVNVLLSQSYIVILSSSADSPTKKSETGSQLTLYGLKLPSASTLYTDMMAMAAAHRFTSPATYSHLLSEAHSVLRSVVHISTDPQHVPLDIEITLYKESCALFADYFLMCENEEDWEMGYKYCLMAGLNPTQVMDRLKKLESEGKEVNVNIDTTQGMCYYLKKCLTNCDEDTVLPPGALNTLLDIIETRSGGTQQFLLSTLVLQSPILRQFATERSIRIISEHMEKSKENHDTSDCLALAVLYVTRDRLKEAGEVLNTNLQSNDTHILIEILQDHWPLLLDNTKQFGKTHEWDWESVTLSELAVLLMEEKPRELAETLSSLVTVKQTLELQNVLQVFLTYLPSRIGTGSTCVSHVLQQFLEGVFIQWHAQDASWKPDPYDTPITEALKILMRSYLSDLIGKSGRQIVTECEAASLFGVKRPDFLQLLPPFIEPDFDDSHQITSLLKLQCLLRSGWLDETALQELIQFVSEFIPQSLGLSLLVLSQPQRAVDLLLEHCPTAIPQYAKDMLSSENEWSYLIASLQSKADEEGVKGSSEAKIYSQVLEEVLDHLAHTLSCDVFCRVLPPGEEYENYILTCQKVAHANHILSVIMATGQRLLATLNL